MTYLTSTNVKSLSLGAEPAIFNKLWDAFKRDYPNRTLVLMPAEIGGCNALTPFQPAAQLSVPVLDADLIGRAFPKVSMCKPATNNAGSCVTAYLSVYRQTKTAAIDVSVLAGQSKLSDMVELAPTPKQGLANVGTDLLKGINRYGLFANDANVCLNNKNQADCTQHPIKPGPTMRN